MSLLNKFETAITDKTDRYVNLHFDRAAFEDFIYELRQELDGAVAKRAGMFSVPCCSCGKSVASLVAVESACCADCF